MLRERVFMTLVLAVIGLAVYAPLRPASPDPVEDARARQTRFYINKVRPNGGFDGVVVGDSRALRAISPQTLSDEIGDRRIFNFAFEAGGLNREMFSAAERLLDTDSRDPFIILAPTSLAFQAWKSENAQYHEYRNKPRDQVWIYRHAGRLAEWLQPVAPAIYLRRVLDLRPSLSLQQDFHEDGWIATDQVPRDDLTDMQIHLERLEENRVVGKFIAEFMAQTRDWTARGIRVFGFFPPAHPRRVALEDSLLEFDAAGFAATFEAAGGTWLDLSAPDYETYDGSHLVVDSAILLSRRLGAAIATRWDD